MNVKCLKVLSLFLLILSSVSNLSHATDRRGRLGVGLNNQLKNDLPSISFKLQKSKSFAFGGLLGLSTDDSNGGFGAGLKVYRNLFDEPQLNFYTALMGALLKEKSAGVEQSGFQVDLTLGSEFHFAGLTSLGFSFEFGVSFNKLDDFVAETTGSHFVVAGIHFYL
ncbi:MAG: hypothetical protein HN509_08450 [Halobacteriovoraceae bacterium]|nr:hypothetical protein [Halobacteriovoraceae bacterium]